ncbi:MAG: hypothetical protein U0174_04955 [Polyangiaceae bacterium]
MAADRHENAGLVASMALLLFGGVSCLGLVVWFRLAPSPYLWKAWLTAGTAVGAIATSAALWRKPSRGPALIGVLLMLGSLARIGAPAEWTGFSLVIVSITAVLMMPVVHAALVLRG